MAPHRIRLVLIAGGLLALAGCASGTEWTTWKEHPTHFASAEHWRFSARNQDGVAPRITEQDVARAREEHWWGGLVPPEPPFDASGRWTGSWQGTGIFSAQRRSTVEARLSQTGPTGQGRLTLADTLAVESIPWAIREAGSAGVPVVVEASGSEVVIAHPSPDRPFTLVFRVEGERLVGRFLHRPSPVELTLTRQRH